MAVNLDARLYPMSGSVLSPKIGSLVWIPHESEGYLPVKIIEMHDELFVGENVFTKEVVELKHDFLDKALDLDKEGLKASVSNMIRLNRLNIATILNNLRSRFAQDEIYTRIDDILISVNPYRNLPIYGEEIRKHYIEADSLDKGAHIYQVVERSCRALMRHKKSQVFLISGESGAGKTESIKLILDYVLERHRSTETREIENLLLDEQLHQSTPLLEAFGNAKTCRNHNSSRFGKWIQLSFSVHADTLQVLGGNIKSYLLERSRIVHQAKHETNFHIFYQLLAAVKSGKLEGELLDILHLDGEISSYHYLTNKSFDGVEIDYDEHWDSTSFALEALMSQPQKHEILKLIAALLHLGNIQFSSNSDNNAVIDGKSKAALHSASSLLGIGVAELTQVLTFKSLQDMGQMGKVILKPYNVDQAVATKNAMAKGIYCVLFNWLVAKINEDVRLDISPKHSTVVDMGLLDIFGFEDFAINSFEQLCINYCNEKLHKFFNEFVFEREIQDYKKEGLRIASGKIEFESNQPVNDLIEDLLVIMDDHAKAKRLNDKDDQLMNKFVNKHGKGKTEKFQQERNSATTKFDIVHFAGPVTYNVEGFVDKNNDLLIQDITDVCSNSDNHFLTGLFDGGEYSQMGPNRKRKNTVGSKFKTDLSELLKTVSVCEPNFIRCIKSNHSAKGGLFDGKCVLTQLVYSGVTSVCRIRQNGFPVRFEFDEFVSEYLPLCDSTAKENIRRHENSKSRCESLCAWLSSKDHLDNVFLGHTKIFLKHQDADKLELLKEKNHKEMTKRIQACVTQFLRRLNGKRFRHCFQGLKEAVLNRESLAIDKYLIQLERFKEFTGQSLLLNEVKQNARIILERIGIEDQTRTKLNLAVVDRNIEAIDLICDDVTRLAENWGDRDLETRLDIPNAKKFVMEARVEMKLNQAKDRGSLAEIELVCKEISDLAQQWQDDDLETRLHVEDAKRYVIETENRSKLKVAANEGDVKEVERISTVMLKHAEEWDDSELEIRLNLNKMKRLAVEAKYNLLLVNALKEGDVDLVESLCQTVSDYATKWEDPALEERLFISEAKAFVMERKNETQQKLNIENQIRTKLDKAIQEENVEILNSVCHDIRNLSSEWEDKEMLERLNVEESYAVFVRKAVESGSLIVLYEIIKNLDDYLQEQPCYLELVKECFRLEKEQEQTLSTLYSKKLDKGFSTIESIDQTEAEIYKICDILMNSVNPRVRERTNKIREKTAERVPSKRMLLGVKTLMESTKKRDIAEMKKYIPILVQYQSDFNLKGFIEKASEILRRYEMEEALNERLCDALESDNVSEIGRVCDEIDEFVEQTNDNKIKTHGNYLKARERISNPRGKDTNRESPSTNDGSKAGIAVIVSEVGDTATKSTILDSVPKSESVAHNKPSSSDADRIAKSKILDSVPQNESVPSNELTSKSIDATANSRVVDSEPQNDSVPNNASSDADRKTNSNILDSVPQNDSLPSNEPSSDYVDSKTKIMKLDSVDKASQPTTVERTPIQTVTILRGSGSENTDQDVNVNPEDMIQYLNHMENMNQRLAIRTHEDNLRTQEKPSDLNPRKKKTEQKKRRYPAIVKKVFNF